MTFVLRNQLLVQPKVQPLINHKVEFNKKKKRRNSIRLTLSDWSNIKKNQDDVRKTKKRKMAMRTKILREAKQQEIDNFFQDQYDSLVVNQVNNINDRSLAEKNPIVEGVYLL